MFQEKERRLQRLGPMMVVLLLFASTASASQGIPGRIPGKGTDLPRMKRQIRDMILNEVTAPAIENLRALLARHPKDAELHILLGEAHYADDAHEKAVESFEKGLAIRPELRGRAFNLGRSYHEISRPKDALGVFETMKKESTAALRSKGWFGTGLVLEEEGRDAEAEAAYRKSIDIDPTSYRPKYRLALMLKDQGKPALAKQLFQFVMDAKPLHHGAAFNLSLVLLRLEERDAGERMRTHYLKILEGKQAISGLKTQLVERPGNWAIMCALGDEYRALESWSDAITWYRRARHANSWEARSAIGLAAAHHGKGESSEAERIYRELLKRTPAPLEAVEPLAKILEARGDDDAARELRSRYGKTD